MKLWQAVLAVGLLAGAMFTTIDQKDKVSIVGAWRMQVLPVDGVPGSGAPYSPHLMTFHADNTVLMTNPTNVQEKAGNGTTDSVGMGAWRGFRHSIKFHVEQENANQPADTPAARLLLDFECTVKRSAFRCTGDATLEGVGSVPAILVGQRMEVR